MYLKKVLRSFIIFAATTTAIALAVEPTRESHGAEVLRPSNQVAWCIVPFDARKRGPAERAAMLKELGITRCAYDWRAKHVPTFEQEILEYRKNGIEFFAFWSVHEEAFKLFEKHGLHPQIWQTMPNPKQPTEQKNIEAAVQSLLPVVQRTKEMGCKLGLYNHGAWGGEPENLVAVCTQLRNLGHSHVGIVYNFHHGHGHVDDWSESFARMKPFLLCLNLNGMNANAQPKILGIGKGTHELEMIRVVAASDYDGPIGILDHRDKLDARDSLLENRDGLAWVRKELVNPGSGGPKPITPVPPAKPNANRIPAGAKHAADATSEELPYDAKLVTQLTADAAAHGDVVRGAAVFADAKLACLSCHRVGRHGGTIGPDLSAIAKQQPLPHIIESVLWPKHDVKPEFVTWQILTADGEILTGYKHAADDKYLTLRDPASGKLTRIALDDIEDESSGSTVMPGGLTAAISRRQQLDLIRFLSELGRDGQPVPETLQTVIAHSQMHKPASAPLVRGPIDPDRWPNSTHAINSHRLYDFYTRQAEYFRKAAHVPMLISSFPGLDGGEQGHWGRTIEQDWRNGRWNATRLGSVQAGVFRANGLTVPRGVCVKLGDSEQLAICFNPETLTYDAVWENGFVTFSPVMHGFLGGLQLQGTLVAHGKEKSPDQDFVYHGYYRCGNRIAFAYRIGDVEFLDAPWVGNGELVREVAPVADHSLRHVMDGGPKQWPQVIETNIVPGTGRPYAIDTIELPFDNPWKALMFIGGHDFFDDGSAMVCTMQGDVWHVSGLDSGKVQPGIARWRRFASGLHHPLGLVIADGKVYVQCRDQLTRLTDLNGNGEADFYECFSNAFTTSAAGHDFICGLQRDADGNFYTASGNQGLLRISADGRRVDVMATGFRNPDGLALLPDGTVTVPCSEGEWTPASMICAVPVPARSSGSPAPEQTRLPPHFGYQGPRNGEPPELPLVYLPRGLDNSSGGQVYIDSDKWGPLKGQLLHLSFGMGSSFVVLRDEVAGQQQGAIIPLAGDFLSGVHRGRIHPRDGQLYVTGMNGWTTFTLDDGCFQRIRYTGDPVQIPVGFHVYENGIRVDFSEPLDASIVTDVSSHFAQCWNYRYSGAYGSVEYSTTHPGVSGHDPLAITSAHVLEDRKSVFLEIPELQPVSQLHLRLHVNQSGSLRSAGTTPKGHDLFVTVHKLDEPFNGFPGHQAREKTIAAHPLLTDLATNAKRVLNPWRKPNSNARKVEIATGKNLTYLTSEFEVTAGESLAVTLSNPDVVPHNWVLIRPGSLRTVGELANKLIASPDAYARQYIPESDSILSYTDIVPPGENRTIYFTAPKTPGRYPFLCTFPGHWMIMNGVMIVKPPM